MKEYDRTPVDGDYELLSVKGKLLIVRSNDGIYRVSSEDGAGDSVQIIADRVEAHRSKRAVTIVKEIPLAEDDVAPILNQLVTDNPKAQIYVSGTLKLDTPEDVTIQPKVGQLPTIVKHDTGVTIEFAPVDEARSTLADQSASGILTARIILVRS
ncbi:MAG: hypothetical protein NVSMB70_18290 [Chamaesiphon sp.]